MIKNQKHLKLGTILVWIVIIIAYVLDDIFYYSGMQLAEILTFPIAIILIWLIVFYMIMPHLFDKKS